MANIQDTPERIAFLVLLFLHDQLTQAQRGELDAWVGGSRKNLLIFEELIEIRAMDNITLLTPSQEYPILIRLFKPNDKIQVERGKYSGRTGFINKHGIKTRVLVYTEKGSFWVEDKYCKKRAPEPDDDEFRILCYYNSAPRDWKLPGDDLY
jgi:hypothetical protein